MARRAVSVSRCLGEAVDALAGEPREQWKAYLDALPETCPRDGCSPGLGCRAYVTEYFRVQWRIRSALEERRALMKARDGVAAHG